MEAVKFVKEFIRMKKAEGVETVSFNIDSLNVELFVAMVEQWSKDHPKKTNREKFLEVFGDVDTKKFMGIEWQWQRWLDQEYKGEEG